MADTGHSVTDLNAVFDQIDSDGSGHLEIHELHDALAAAGMGEDTFSAIMDSADQDSDGTVTRQEFLKAMEIVNKKGGNVGELSRLVQATKEIMQVKMEGGGVHTYSQEELAAFSDHINNVLGDDPDCSYLLPVDPNTDALFQACGDGVLLAKFVNCIKENTIDWRVVNKRRGDKPMTIFKVNENLNLVINAAKAVGVAVHNVGAGDINQVRNPSLVLGLLWQMVKLHLLADLNLKAHPELLRLLEEGESLEHFMSLSPEEILKRWMNYHLAEAGSSRRVKNFSGDVKDSEAYTIVMNRIAPQKCDTSAMNIANKTQRAGKVLDNAKKLGCRPFIKAKDIASGNEKLNLAFVADLFNTCPGLDPLEDEEEMMAELTGMMDDDAGDSREERVFRMWANCLGIPDFYLNNLFEDFEDGLNLLKVIDAVEPGTVNWKKVEKKPKMIFKKNSNNSYACTLGKAMGFSLVGIGGADITAKNKKLVLAFVWQLFRYHSIKFLKNLGEDVNDTAILEFANAKVQEVGGDAISSFKDSSISTGKFVCDLAKSIQPEVFDDELVTEGTNEDDATLNARYAISVCRKHDVCIFCLPEDIVEVKPKMILTFCAAVMERLTR